MFCLRYIEYVHQNLIFDLKTNLSAFGAEPGKRGCQCSDGYGFELIFQRNSNS